MDSLDETYSLTHRVQLQGQGHWATHWMSCLWNDPKPYHRPEAQRPTSRWIGRTLLAESAEQIKTLQNRKCETKRDWNELLGICWVSWSSGDADEIRGQNWCELDWSRQAKIKSVSAVWSWGLVSTSSMLFVQNKTWFHWVHQSPSFTRWLLMEHMVFTPRTSWAICKLMWLYGWKPIRPAHLAFVRRRGGRQIFTQETGMVARSSCSQERRTGTCAKWGQWSRSRYERLGTRSYQEVVWQRCGCWQ